MSSSPCAFDDLEEPFNLFEDSLDLGDEEDDTSVIPAPMRPVPTAVYPKCVSVQHIEGKGRGSFHLFVWDVPTLSLPIL